MSAESTFYTAEVHFAQKLAGNEKKCRDRALKRLKKWLTARSVSKNDFSKEDMIKLWKGLFYCMWMSDKPLVQEELATSISELMYNLHSTSSAFLFIETFFITMAREWYGIDRLRLDKFMMFVRRFVRTCYEFLLKQDWQDDLVDGFVDVLRRTVIYPEATANNVPFGLQSHMCAVHMEEFVKASKDEAPQEVGLKLLDLYCQLIVKSKDDDLKAQIEHRIFQYLMRISTVGLQDEENSDEENEERDYVEEEVAPEISDPEVKKSKPKRMKHSYRKMVDTKVNEAMEVPYSQFNYSAIADRIFELASENGVTKRTRKLAYNLVKKFRQLANGVYPLVLKLPEEVDSEIEDSEVDEAVERLDEELENDTDPELSIKRLKPSKKRKKLRKRRF